MTSDRYVDYDDYYRRKPEGPGPKEQRSLSGGDVLLYDVCHVPGEIRVAPNDYYGVVLARDGRAKLRTDLGSGRWEGLWSSGAVILAPNGVAHSYQPEAPCRNLTVAINSTAVRKIVEESGFRFSGFGRLHEAPFQDAFVETLCQRLWDDIEDGSPLGRLFADGAVQALTATFVRRSGTSISTGTRTGGLAPYRLRRVQELIHDRLADDIRLDDLARQAGLSSFHFARAFRQETGTTPHRYLLERRVERARELLIGTDMLLSEVARRCGFATQAGFTAAFRRVTGATPGRWRHER